MCGGWGEWKKQGLLISDSCYQVSLVQCQIEIRQLLTLKTLCNYMVTAEDDVSCWGSYCDCKPEQSFKNTACRTGMIGNPGAGVGMNWAEVREGSFYYMFFCVSFHLESA